MDRLTKKSQALALDEFQTIDFNLHMMKHSEEAGSQKKGSFPLIISPTTLLTASSTDNLKSESKTKILKSTNSSRTDLHKRQSKSKDRLGFSSSTDIINGRKISSDEHPDKKMITEEKQDSEVRRRSLEESLLRIMQLNELDTKKQFRAGLSFGSRDSCLDICSKKTCLDSSTRLPPIKRTNSQNLFWDIRAISGVEVPSKPVKAVHRVNLRRREKHDNIIKEMTLRMDDLNETLEQEIRKQAENVVSNIQMIRDNVHQILSNVDFKPCAYLSQKVIDRMQEIMKQLNENRLVKIDEFCNYVRKLERQRSERFKILLKNAYRDMHDVMFLMPYEIQKFFEKKVQHLNQITMNNYHCYTELEEKLKLQMEEELKTWLQKLKLFENLNKYKLDAEQGSPDISLEFTEEEPPPTVNLKAEIMTKIEKAEEDFRKFKEVIGTFKYLKSNPTLEVFQNYLGEMEIAATSLIQTGLVDQHGIYLDPKNIQYLSEINSIEQRELEKMWTDGIEDMLKILDNNFRSFSNSTKIFNCYSERNDELNILYTQQLFLLVTKNDKMTMQMNNTMNLLIDTLRQDTFVESLEKSIEQIKSTISNIDSLIRSNVKDEMSLVDKFHQFGISNSDVLVDEIGRFVKQFVPPPDADPRIMKKRASWMDVYELETNDHLFSRDYLNCRFMIQGIDNWQFGVWQALITIMETAKQTIGNNLMEWASKEKKVLSNRSELKIKINNIRMNGIEEDFWRVRLAELKLHEDRFEQHEMAVRDTVEQLAHLRDEMKATCETYLKTKLEKEVETAMSEYNNVKKKRHINAIINKLWYIYSMASQEIKLPYKTFCTQYTAKLNNLRNSHLKFIGSIRFFSEDGNFAIEEAKQMTKKILSFEKVFVKEFTNNQDTMRQFYDAFMTESLNRVETPLYILNKALDEFTFKENVETSIRKFHSEISNSVFVVRYEIRKLEAKINNCRDASYSENHLGSYEWLFSFSKVFKEVLNDIEILMGKLQYDESIAPDEKFLKLKIEVSRMSLVPPTVTKTKKTVADVSKDMVEEPDMKGRQFERKRSMRITSGNVRSKNYAYILYPIQPVDDGSFLSKLHYQVYRSYCDVQEMAKVFYEGHGEILEPKRIPSEYKSFVEEVLAKYKYYQLQLEFTWLECATEFSHLVTNFHTFLDNYYIDTITKYFEVRKEKLTEQYEVIKKKLEESMECVEDYYISIHNRLKPMFGHPELTKMLTIIDAYMDQAEDFITRTLFDNLEPSKETIKSHSINTESIFLDMERILSCIKGSTSVLTMKKDLETQLLRKTENMKNILSLEDEPSTEGLDKSAVELNVKKRLQEYKKKAQIPLDVKISTTSIMLSSSTMASTKKIDVEELLRANYAEYEAYADKIEVFREKCTYVHLRYKAMWKQDIDRILELYKVKYDTPTYE